MSKRYPGGLITKTPVTPAGPYADSTAPGIWTLEQQAAYTKLGQWPTAGNVNPNAFIENLFSTYLYTGNDSAQTITNGIDLAGEGGLVWGKSRSASQNHRLYDTARGSSYSLISNATSAESNQGTNACAFNADGFSLSAASGIVGSAGFGGPNYVSWTFREQPKFFDVVTYSGTGSAGLTVNHNLGSVPGTIIVKITSGSGSWFVYHRSLGATKYLNLDATAAAGTSSGIWNNTEPTSTVFTLGNDGSVNSSGQTYVAYLFAHDAGGFGLTGTDNVISCGSYTGDGSNGQSVSIGYEPQWLLIKRTDTTANWQLQDNMRPFSVTATEWLNPNTSNAESTGGVAYVSPTATGFTFTSGGASVYNANGGTYIYIAIRRGPMAVPTLGTSVFNSITRTGTGTAATITGVGFAPDLVLGADRTGANTGDDSRYFWVDKLRGRSQYLSSAVTAAEVGPSSATQDVTAFGMDGISVGTTANAYFNVTSDPLIHHYFKRAPSFFDEVCYTGNSTGSTPITHNLGVVPELIIVKSRSAARNWPVYIGSQGNNGNSYLNLVNAWASGSDMFANTTPTASEFYVGNNALTNNTAETYVAFLFATCAGVSKVGSYTGTGTLTTINCGFTGGARFVLIKKTSGVGSWFIWDSARGMVSGTDPSLRLNVTDAEQSGDSIYSIATGFQLLASPFENVNTNGDTYIFLAIA